MAFYPCLSPTANRSSDPCGSGWCAAWPLLPSPPAVGPAVPWRRAGGRARSERGMLAIVMAKRRQTPATAGRKRTRTEPETDSDGAWKEPLDRFFEACVAFFFPLAHADIDWSRACETLDKELQQVVRRAKQGRRYVDKLVKVWLKSGEGSCSSTSRCRRGGRPIFPSGCTCTTIGSSTVSSPLTKAAGSPVAAAVVPPSAFTARRDRGPPQPLAPRPAGFVSGGAVRFPRTATGGDEFG
jgi:hypothetical protein